MIRIPATAVIWWLAVMSLFVIAALAGYVQVDVATLGLVVLCAACELLDSTLGMGYGTTLTPVLILAGMEPLVLVPTILVSELLSGFGAGFFHADVGNIRLQRGSPDLRAVIILSLCSIVGVYAGVELALNLPKQALIMMISVIILSAGIYILLRARRPSVYRSWKIVVLAVLASFNKAVSGGGYGPLMTSGQILSGVPGRSAVGITSIAEGFTCLAAASLFLLRGRQLDPALLIPVLTGALISVPLSAQLVRRFSEESIKRIIAVFTIALGLFSLLRALT